MNRIIRDGNRYILFVVLVLFFSMAATGQTKRALLIGVGTYPDVRWRPLSAANDIVYLKQALLLQGFQATEMNILTDSAATFAGIEKALNQLQEETKQGDILYVHFSGHGQQIEDDTENADESDGYDEALVPWDARGKYDPVKYYGQKHFRDDLLGKHLEALRTKLGITGSLMVVIDACHSGTATRSGSFAVVRGDPNPFASPEYKPRLSSNLSRTNAAEGFMSAAPLLNANMVVFSASSPSQVNYETHDEAGLGVGSLSYAVARALQRLDTKNSTYADLFAQVKALIQADYPQQLPMMEGDGSQRVFGGNYLSRNEQLKVDRWLTDTSFVLSIGQLQGVYQGSVISILDATTRRSLGTAVVAESNALSSVGHTSKPFDKSQPYAVSIQSYGAKATPIQVTVVPGKGVTKQQTQRLSKWLQQQPQVELSSTAQFMLAINTTPAGLLLEMVETGDMVRWQQTIAANALPDDADTKTLQSILKSAGSTRFLRSLPDDGPLAAQVQLTLQYGSKTDATSEYKIPRGAPYTFSIKNNSDSRVYFNLLNILPTNQTQVLLPQPDDQPQDYSIGAGQTFDIEGISVDDDAPLGKEWLKVVLSARPIDLRPVFMPLPVEGKKRGVAGPFENWLNNSLDNTNTPIRTRSAGADEVTIISAGFTVVPKQ